jgi:hypothetical protein
VGDVPPIITRVGPPGLGCAGTPQREEAAVPDNALHQHLEGVCRFAACPACGASTRTGPPPGRRDGLRSPWAHRLPLGAGEGR